MLQALFSILGIQQRTKEMEIPSLWLISVMLRVCACLHARACVYDGRLVGEGLPGDPVGKKQAPGALSLPVQKGEGVRVTHSPAAVSPSTRGRETELPAQEHMCRVGVEGGRTEVPKLAKAWPLPISDPLEALSSLYPELGCSGGR